MLRIIWKRHIHCADKFRDLSVTYGGSYIRITTNKDLTAMLSRLFRRTVVILLQKKKIGKEIGHTN
jgi:hypothetical protein